MTAESDATIIGLCMQSCAASRDGDTERGELLLRQAIQLRRALSPFDRAIDELQASLRGMDNVYPICPTNT